MGKLSAERLLEEVTRYYLSSYDFNGIPVRELVKNLDIDEWQPLVPLVK